MKSLLKILKKFTIPILITICLLVLQAQLDLSLPDYTANIINVGIQEKGITYAVPLAIRKNVFEELLSVSSESDFLKDRYELKSKEDFSSKEQEKYLKKYPMLETESIYLLKDISDEEKEQLESKMAIDLMFVEFLLQDKEEVRQMLPMKIPDGKPLMEFYQSFPKAQQQEFKKKFEEAFRQYDDSMLNQIAIESVKQEYTSLGVNLDDLQMDYIYHNGLIMLLLALLLMAAAIGVGFMASRIATKFGYYLRNEVVSKIMSFSSKEFNEFSAASLITRSTNDIQQIQMIFVMFFRIIIFAPILGFGALFKVLGNSMNWVLGLAIGVILLIMIFLFVFAMPKFRLIQKLVDRLNLVTRERLTGVPVIRAFGTAKHEEQRFDKANDILARTMQFCDRVMGVMMPTMMFIMNGVAILIIWVGASQIDLGTLQVGTLMAFITYTIQVIMSFLMISMVSIMLPRALVSVRRICEVLDKKNSIIEQENPEEITDHTGFVEFKDVSFAYPDADEEVLSNISFTAKPGTTTAIIGSTGSGKSTLINLIPRFFDVTKGEILVDGKDVRKVDIHDLRDCIGYVPQKGNLFSGTIRSNVLFGHDESDDKTLKEACEVAQATDFILKLPEKYESLISQGGTNVSGGQRQRLSIARAIAKKPEIYIFDDSFSALDFKTDANLRKALYQYTDQATIFIVAQRISTILNADQIIVLDKGEIVGIGTHQELLTSCPIYKEIALSQLKESELNA